MKVQKQPKYFTYKPGTKKTVVPPREQIKLGPNQALRFRDDNDECAARHGADSTLRA